MNEEQDLQKWLVRSELKKPRTSRSSLIFGTKN